MNVIQDSRIVAGYDSKIVVTLVDSTGAFVNVSGATIKAAVVDPTHSSVWIDPVTCNSAHAEASWATGVVVIEFTAAQTTPAPSGRAFIEISVDKAGKRTAWFAAVSITPGLVS